MGQGFSARFHKSGWVCKFFNHTLGGIDGSSSQKGEGTNGSIRPMFLKKVLKAICDISEFSEHARPSLIDAGCAEGRVFLHWAEMLGNLPEQAKSISPHLQVYGIEKPTNQSALSYIHEAACAKVREILECDMKISVVWKSCSTIGSLRQAFPIMAEGSLAVYSFWTAWIPKDKQHLLRLVACEKSVKVLALSFRRGDRRIDGGTFDEAYVLEQLETWEVAFRLVGCKLIGRGNESVTFTVFTRVKPFETFKIHSHWPPQSMPRRSRPGKCTHQFF
jgi:hypothetical protein